MREADLLAHLQRVAVADGERRRRPLAHAVHGEDGGARERRREEGAGRVAQVVFTEEQFRIVAELRVDLAQLAEEVRLEEQFLAQPHRHGQPERPEASWREREIRLEQPLELHERLLVEHDAIDVAQRDGCLGEARLDAPAREARVVPDAAEALLLRGGEHFGAADKSRGAVVVVRRDPEDQHQAPGIRTACR